MFSLTVFLFIYLYFIFIYIWKYIWVSIGSQLRDSVTPAVNSSNHSDTIYIYIYIYIYNFAVTHVSTAQTSLWISLISKLSNQPSRGQCSVLNQPLDSLLCLLICGVPTSRYTLVIKQSTHIRHIHTYALNWIN